MRSLWSGAAFLTALLSCALPSFGQSEDEIRVIAERQKAYRDVLSRSNGSVPPDIQMVNYAVDDSLYYPGPGDQYRLRWWGVGTGDEVLVVNGRHEIVLPEVGVLKVRGLPLSQIRDSVERRIRTRFSNVRVVDLSVQKLASVQVHVTGAVPNPGIRVLSGGSRLSKALEDAGLLVPEVLGGISQGNYFLPLSQSPPSLRRVWVRKSSGDTSSFDLALAFNRGEQSQDPLVFNGDRIEVGHVQNLVAVSGSGVRSRLVESVPGESYRKLLEVVGVGPITNAECLDSQGSASSVALDDVFDARCVGVRSVDTERIRSTGVVWVLGMVNQPGAVPFRHGITSEAAVELAGGAILPRDSVTIVAIRHHWPRLRAFEAIPGEISSQYPEVQSALNLYRTHPGGGYSRPDEVLGVMDTVVVSERNMTVWVGGQVTRPGFVPWTKGASIDQLVASAGGYSRRPWKSRVRVLDPSTGQVVSESAGVPPGAIVIVPEKRYLYPEQWLQISSSVLLVMISLWSVYLQQSNR